MHSSAVFKQPREDNGPHKCDVIISFFGRKEKTLTTPHHETIGSVNGRNLFENMRIAKRHGVEDSRGGVPMFLKMGQQGRFERQNRKSYIVRHENMAQLSHIPLGGISLKTAQVSVNNLHYSWR